MKKALSSALAAVLTVSAVALSGCSGCGEKIEPNKTQLYIGITQGGLGTV